METLTNETVGDFLRKSPHATKKVRWINVQGISFDVIKCLGNTFNLHPLAIEDIFHVPQSIKVDTYADHVFINMLLLSVFQ